MTNRLQHILKWTVWNAIWVTLIVLGAFQGVVWAGNILIFLLWLNFVSCIGWNAIENHAPEKLPEIREKYRGIPKSFSTFDLWFDIGMACALVGAGWFWMGGLLAFSAFGISGAKDKLIYPRRNY